MFKFTQRKLGYGVISFSKLEIRKENDRKSFCENIESFALELCIYHMKSNILYLLT